MRNDLNNHRCLATAVMLLAVLTHASAAQDVVSTSFQNGIDGYTGTVDRQISTRPGDEADGIDSASYFLDGINTTTSPDRQGFIRFDDIFGNGNGQIPVDATILSAQLTLNTSLASNAQTSGPYGVSGLLQPFDTFTSYLDFEASLDAEPESRGAWWQDDSATRPVGGFGFQVPGTPDTASVTSIVQAWADGSLDNNGFVVQAGRNDILGEAANTSDGWSIRTTGFPIANTRPKLQVDYTTAAVEINSFQDGAAGYNGTTMAIVRSGTNAIIEDTDDPLNPEITEDAGGLEQTFLDGVRFTDVDGNTNSPDDFALLKFDNVFGSDPGQAPSEVPVAKAWAVITTGDLDVNARTSGSWSAHTVLGSWDTTSLHSSFGDTNGLQEFDGDIGPALDSLDGFIRGAEVWFDVTEKMESVRNGETDFGIAVLTNRTADGWQINTHGSATESVRPRLVVYSADLDLGNQVAEDCNGDGVVDAVDLSCVHLTADPIASRDAVLATIPSLPGDLDGNGDVAFADFLVLSGNFGQNNDIAPAYTDGNIDMVNGVEFADFLVLSGNFGKTPVGEVAAAVPEPSAWVLLALGGLGMGLRRSRQTRALGFRMC